MFHPNDACSSWIRAIRRYALLVFFRPALWRYGVLFSRKRYGVMGALKKALWRYEGPPAPPPSVAVVMNYFCMYRTQLSFVMSAAASDEKGQV